MLSLSLLSEVAKAVVLAEKRGPHAQSPTADAWPSGSNALLLLLVLVLLLLLAALLLPLTLSSATAAT